MLAQLSRAAARTAPVVRRAPLRCLSAQPIDPSTSQRVTVTETTGTKHPLGVGKCSVEYLAGGHSVYSPEELDVKLTHTPPKTTTDKAAY